MSTELKVVPGIIEPIKPLVLTRTDLESRLTELKQARNEMTANLQALSGAIQQVELFIKDLIDREDVGKPTNKKPTEVNPEKK